MARREEEPRRSPQASWRRLGYGPDKRLKIKVSTRNLAVYRDPAVILIDQLKEIYIDGELDVVETQHLVRQGGAQGLFGRPQPHRQRQSTIPTRPSTRTTPAARSATTPTTATRICEKLFDQQSTETDVDKRKKLVWEIDKKLQEDVARPIIYPRAPATCW